jgi:hypothetical protein
VVDDHQIGKFKEVGMCNRRGGLGKKEERKDVKEGES